MDLTKSYERNFSTEILNKFAWAEVRNGAAVLRSTNPEAFEDLTEVLEEFQLKATDITDAGGQESAVPHRLNDAFRSRGWREGDYTARLSSVLKLLPYKPAGEAEATLTEASADTTSYKIDNILGRVALDVEWHAKDGNLDRDVAAYRSLYEAGIIDAAVVVTRHFASIRALSVALGRAGGFSTTTTTTIDKLGPRLIRGDGGGCPILAIAITDACYEGDPLPAEPPAFADRVEGL
jgi:hypothetical protein